MKEKTDGREMRNREMSGNLLLLDGVGTAALLRIWGEKTAAVRDVC